MLPAGKMLTADFWPTILLVGADETSCHSVRRAGISRTGRRRMSRAPATRSRRQVSRPVVSKRSRVRFSDLRDAQRALRERCARELGQSIKRPWTEEVEREIKAHLEKGQAETRDPNLADARRLHQSLKRAIELGSDNYTDTPPLSYADWASTQREALIALMDALHPIVSASSRYDRSGRAGIFDIDLPAGIKGLYGRGFLGTGRKATNKELAELSILLTGTYPTIDLDALNPIDRALKREIATIRRIRARYGLTLIESVRKNDPLERLLREARDSRQLWEREPTSMPTSPATSVINDGDVAGGDNEPTRAHAPHAKDSKANEAK